jgi:hypothetical protein
VAAKFVHGVLSLLVWALMVVLVVLSLRQLIVFFGQFASQEWGRALKMLANPLVIPFGQTDVRSPYGGKFDVDNALTIGIVLVGEWGLSRMKDHA